MSEHRSHEALFECLFDETLDAQTRVTCLEALKRRSAITIVDDPGEALEKFVRFGHIVLERKLAKTETQS